MIRKALCSRGLRTVFVGCQLPPPIQLASQFSSVGNGKETLPPSPPSQDGNSSQAGGPKFHNVWQKLKSDIVGKKPRRPYADGGSPPGGAKGDFRPRNNNGQRTQSNNINNQSRDKRPHQRRNSDDQRPSSAVERSSNSDAASTSGDKRPAFRSGRGPQRPRTKTPTRAPGSGAPRSGGGGRGRRPPSSDSVAEGAEGEVGGVGRNRLRGRRSDDDDTPFIADTTRETEISKADAALLFDDEYFVNRVKKESGDFIVEPEEDSDFIDLVLSRAYIESIKTQDHTFEELYASRGAQSRFHIPRPRSLHQLRCALQPKIDAPVDSPGYQHGVDAWTVLQHNTYYSDKQKRKVASGIAQKVNATLEKAKTLKSDDFDETLDPSFYKGPEELREEIEGEDSEDKTATAAKAVSQTSTAQDWDKDAIVDEDELEK